MGQSLRILITICIVIAAIIFLPACHSGVTSLKRNDTTSVLQILLDSAFYKNGLATAAQVNLHDPLKDTVIFKRNEILTHHLPKNWRYRLLTEDEMCELMSIHKAANLHFLELDEFAKIANGYRVALGIHCMFRGTSVKEPEGTSQTACERDKYCNAVLYMDIIKSGNSFIGNKFSIADY